MNKILVFIIIVVVFIIGIRMGDSSYSSNYILEQEKEYFESEIAKPNNDYVNKTLTPEDNIVNKLAKKIEDKMDKTIEKLKNILKSI